MVDALCVVVLAIAAFSDGMAAWGGEFAKPHPAVHATHWAVLAVGIVLAGHAVYAYWHWWIPDAGWQGIFAIVALIVAFGLLTSPGDGAAKPNQPTPGHAATTGPGQGATTGRDYCYSGGQCFIDGVPVSGHP